MSCNVCYLYVMRVSLGFLDASTDLDYYRSMWTEMDQVDR